MPSAKAKTHHPPTHQHRPSLDLNDSDNVPSTLPSLSKPQPRSNTTLNLSVLRRHNPSITQILSIGPYAVIYTFSPSTQAWEKAGIEGTLFVCQLSPHPTHAFDGDEDDEDDAASERYTILVLNRRGLDNFSLELHNEDDVEVTEEYIILQGRDRVSTLNHSKDDGYGRAEREESAEPVIYGLWIFAEPPPSSTAEMRTINARVIQDCAARAEMSGRVRRGRIGRGRVEC